MSSVSTFGAFTTARLGMYAAMKGLDVTGHNIGNINTHGYTRQTLDQYSLRLGGADRYATFNDARVGSGVIISGISQLRDPYLDIRYRNEMASVGSLDSKLAGLEDLSKILDEVGMDDGHGVVEKAFNDLLEKLAALSDDATSAEDKSLVRGSAESLVKLLNSHAKRLETVAKNQENSYRGDIDKVNTILQKIANCNDSIRKSEIHGDNALELRDQRNVLIDELSQFVKVTVTYEEENLGHGVNVQKMVIKLGEGGQGVPTLVDGEFAGQLSIDQVPTLNEHYDPTSPTPNDPLDPDSWQYMMQDPAHPNDPTKLIPTHDLSQAKMYDNPDFSLNLSALTNRKGDVKAGSIAVDPLSSVLGALESGRELLTGAGEFTPEGAPNYAAAVSKRGIPYYQKSLDALANKLADVLNGANPTYLTNKNGDYMDQDGKQIMDVDGTTPLNTNMTLTPAQETILAGAGVKIGGVLFSNASSGDATTGITASNISISQGWTNGSTELATYVTIEDKGEEGGTSVNTNILHMISLIKGSNEYKPSDTIAGGSDTPFFKGSLQEMYTNSCGVLAKDMNSTMSMLENFATTAEELNMSRSSISGVDLNDEAANMMMYQKSYSAAARLMTTIDEALDKLINGTGVVGR